MIRRTALGLAACLPLAGPAGCVSDSANGPSFWGDHGTLAHWLGWDDSPRAPRFSPASLQTAERVESLGRRIMAQNTFAGIDPLFRTIGVPEPVLFHRGTSELFVSEGLVTRCKSDAELAAVLCSELGQMMAEQRSPRAGRDRDQIPDAALPDGGRGLDGTRDAELAMRARQPRTAATPPPDAAKLSRELLQGAGFDPAELDRAEPLVKQSDRGEALRKQMAGSAAIPKWEK